MSEEIAELVKRFKTGDEEAFNELVRLFEKRIYAHTYQMVGNHTEADEILQETFVRIVKNIARLRSNANFTSFIYRIATNLSIDLIRKRQRKIINIEEGEIEQMGKYQLELSRSISTPEEEHYRKELLKIINEAIADLPPRQKAVIILHDVEGHSKKEISKIMSCPQPTVRSNLHIARRKVKKILKEILKSDSSPE